MTYTIKLTERPFYGKFTHRIKIKWPEDRWSRASQRKVNKILGLEIKSRWAGTRGWSYKLRRYVNKGAMFYYFNDSNLIKIFEENFNIYELCKPVNQEHIDIMFENTRIRIRDKLFYNKFRWAIRFHWKIYGDSKEEAVKIVRKWLTNQNREAKKDYLISPHSSFIIYSNKKSDVAAIRLMFTEIDIIDEIKLIEELEEE